MAKEIKLPKVSMGQTEGSISDWLVEEGTWVEKDQMIMVMETEKVAYEIESSDAGYIVFQIELNEAVPCETVVALLAETEEELANLMQNKKGDGTAQPVSSPPQIAPTPSNVAGVLVREEIRPNSSQAIATPSANTNARSQSNRRVLITPVAKKKCQIHNLDISKITGTGPNGRIQNRDVEKVLNQQQQAPAVVAASPAPVATSKVEMFQGTRVKASIPFSGMRKAIAEGVMKSLQNTAQLSWSAEIDVTDILKLRKKWNTKLADKGDKISINDIMVYVLAKAIKQVPQVNSALVGNEIKIWEDIHIGIAAAMKISEYDYGLVVPVVRNAGQMSLIEISRASKVLIGKAREGTLTQEDMQGGTISISNNGSLGPGWRIATPVLVYPQAVLIQPCGMEERPVVRKGKIVARTIMPMSYTFDHRVLDAVPMYDLHSRMKEMLEDMDYLVL